MKLPMSPMEFPSWHVVAAGTSGLPFQAQLHAVGQQRGNEEDVHRQSDDLVFNSPARTDVHGTRATDDQTFGGQSRAQDQVTRK